MPKYALVIDDPIAHHAAEIERNVRVHTQRVIGSREVDPAERARVVGHVERRIRETVGAPKAAGELHTVADSECPDGLQNCRQCGDPAHRDTCRAAGHCPHCGTRHGIAPESYLQATGVALQVLDDPQAHLGRWDRTTRSFVPQPAHALHEERRRADDPSIV